MKRRAFIQAGTGAAMAAGLAGAFPALLQAADKGIIQRTIPSSGQKIPVIGLGTSGPFEVQSDAAALAPLREVVDAFFAGGATLIDTSPMYSTAEKVLGELLSPAQQRSAFIATKVWTRGEAEGIAQMQQSMALMKRDSVDLMQVHNLLDLETQLRTLRKWKEEGKIRYIGVTHFTVASHADLEALIKREPLDFLQFNYSATTPDAENRLLPLCADRGVATLINRAFDDGRIFARVKDRPLPGWAAEIDCTTWAQLLLKFVIAHPAVTCVIPATGKVRNLRDNLGGGSGRLPDARQLAQIRELVRT